MVAAMGERFWSHLLRVDFLRFGITWLSGIIFLNVLPLANHSRNNNAGQVFTRIPGLDKTRTHVDHDDFAFVEAHLHVR